MEDAHSDMANAGAEESYIFCRPQALMRRTWSRADSSHSSGCNGSRATGDAIFLVIPASKPAE